MPGISRSGSCLFGAHISKVESNIFVGFQKIKDFYVGDDKVKAIYLGDKKVMG